MNERIGPGPAPVGEGLADVQAELPGIDLGLDPVLIVGAGPVGMTAALMLAYYGIRSIILDDDNKLSYGSRAIAIHRSALEVWEKLGAVEPMLAKGMAWHTRRTYFRDQELFRQQMPPLAPGVLPTFINLQQCHTEAFLLEQIQGTRLIDIRWLHRVVGLRQERSGVTLEVKTSFGPGRFHGSYVLACDGARSTIRNLLNLPFPGTTHEDRFLIVDIRAELSFPGEPRFFFDPPSNPGRTLLIHPQPDNIWRIDWQLPVNTDIAAEYRPENLERRIRAVIGPDVPYELVWMSDYRFHQRLAPNFRQGDVFLLGDAAHLVAPFGARGMNSGIHDVENLCWKLWLVLTGQAPAALLDTYQTERWAAQQHNQDVTSTTMRFMVPPTPRHLQVRNAVLRLSPYLRFLRRHVNSGKMIAPFTYQESPILLPDAGLAPLRGWAWRKAPALGARVPDGPCEVAGPGGRRPERLRHLLGLRFTALLWASSQAQARAWVIAFGATATMPVSLCLVLRDAWTAEALPPLPPGVRVLLDTTGALAQAYAARPGSLYLVRPDGHLAARRRRARPQDLPTLVRAALGAAPSPAPAPSRNGHADRLEPLSVG